MSNFGGEFKWVLFDFGGVLIDWKSALGGVGNLIGLNSQETLKIIIKSTPLLDTGKLIPIDFWSNIASESKLKTSPFDLENAWLSNHFAIVPVWNLVPSLKNRYKLGVLTNMWKDYRKIILEKNKKDLSSFDAVFDSSEVGFRKPEMEIYKYIEGKLKIRGKSILFIDDAPENLENPRKLGWQTFLFDTKKADDQVLRLEKLLKYD